MWSGMSGRNALRAVAVAFAVASACGNVSAVAAPVQQAAGGKTLVVMGDSYSANGFRWDGSSTECQRSPVSWPNKLSKLMGVAGTPDFEDVSCPGASLESHTAYTLLIEARKAAADGAFGPRTRVITLQFGMNDTWGSNKTMLWTSLEPCVFNFRDGCGLEAAEQGRISDYRAVSGSAYASRIRAVVDYLRYHAPQARIVLVGYPELFPPHQDTACINVLGVGAVVQNRGRALVEYLDRIDAAERAAAEMLHLDFFDARAITAGHGLCSAQPWLNGVFDPRASLAGIPFHPSEQGDSVLASALGKSVAP